MARYIALLRAINVGGHVVKMERLRAELTALGLTGVETFIASGNVLFDSRARNTAALETRIERRLHAALDYEVTTFIRTPAELAAVAAYTPFDLPEPTAGSGALSAVFLKTAADAEIARRVEQLATEVDAFHLHGRELYWRCAVRQNETRVSGARLERALGGPATARNITTVRKLAALAPGPARGYHS